MHADPPPPSASDSEVAAWCNARAERLGIMPVEAFEDWYDLVVRSALRVRWRLQARRRRRVRSGRDRRLRVLDTFERAIWQELRTLAGLRDDAKDQTGLLRALAAMRTLRVVREQPSKLRVVPAKHHPWRAPVKAA